MIRTRSQNGGGAGASSKAGVTECVRGCGRGRRSVQRLERGGARSIDVQSARGGANCMGQCTGYDFTAQRKFQGKWQPKLEAFDVALSPPFSQDAKPVTAAQARPLASLTSIPTRVGPKLTSKAPDAKIGFPLSKEAGLKKTMALSLCLIMPSLLSQQVRPC